MGPYNQSILIGGVSKMSDNKQPVLIQTKENKKITKSHFIYLSDGVESAEKYRELAHFLRHGAQDKENVNIYLANFGGYCHGVISLVNAIKSCKSTVNMVVTSPCYSAGTTLALAGDNLTLEDNTFLMFHNYSGGHRGKGNEMALAHEHTQKWIYKYFIDLHTPFLSDEEVSNLLKDQDIYIHADDKSLAKRIKRHFNHRNAKRGAK